MVGPGDDAPEFELPDQNGVPVSLADYRGETVVVYFYPQAGTDGCTTEACSFRDNWNAYQEAGVQVVGISMDPAEDNAAFAAAQELPFPVLSDPSGDVPRAYDSYAQIEHEGEQLEIAVRNTFVVGPDGTIQAVYEDVSPEAHADEILADIQG
ncbi:MAG: peroxiredoxin [Halobacteriales archaeon]